MSNDAHDGSHDHEVEITSCDDVLSHVFEFLDRETDDARRAVIAEHLEDCSPCLRQFGIEQEFKALVRRRCGGDPTPVGLRDRIKLQLTTVSFEEDGTQVWVEKTTSVRMTTEQERPAAS
jgi:mycothiol system anti-sigma-R factor